MATLFNVLDLLICWRMRDGQHFGKTHYLPHKNATRTLCGIRVPTNALDYRTDGDGVCVRCHHSYEREMANVRAAGVR